LDTVLSHIHIANLLVWAMLLTGARLLFRLRKFAYLLFIGAFGNFSIIRGVRRWPRRPRDLAGVG
jgi:hypothetical protein